MTEPSRPVALRHQRELTITRLCEHFARDHISADELEKLIDGAHEAKSLAELDALVQNLPSLAAAEQTAPALAEPGEVEESQFVVAVMGGAERKGPWLSARTIRVVALMGGAMLDFRQVRLPRGTTDIQVFAWMGGVEIIVPPGVAVSCDGTGIMGGFEHVESGDVRARDPNAPLLLIRGVAVMGGVEITERHLDESASDAKRRRKRERRSRAEARKQLRSREDG